MLVLPLLTQLFQAPGVMSFLLKGPSLARKGAKINHLLLINLEGSKLAPSKQMNSQIITQKGEKGRYKGAQRSYAERYAVQGAMLLILTTVCQLQKSSIYEQFLRSKKTKKY